MTRFVERKPDDASDAGGIRLDSSGERLSWSVSYFQGPSKRPNLAISPEQVVQGVVGLDHPMAKVYGLDFEFLSGSWVVRGEAALHDFERSGTNLLSSRESFSLAVLGVERDFGNVSAFLQGVYRRTHDFLDPDKAPELIRPFALANATVNEEAQRSLHGVGGGLNWNTSDMRWSASLDLAYLACIDDFAARPRIRYQLDDSTSVWAGADFLSGSDEGPLGRLQDNSAVFVGISRAAPQSG